MTAALAWGKLYSMSPSDDFYLVLSSLLQQTTQKPDAPPNIPLKHWQAGSAERCLLEDLQGALIALRSSGQNYPSLTDEREQRYRSIFESASDGLIIQELETGRVFEVNPAACAMYGYARDEFIGLHPTRFIHPDSSHPFPKYVQAIQSQGTHIALQAHIRRDGSKFL